MALNSRQQRVYTHVATVLRTTNTPDGETYAVVYVDQPCYAEFTQNIDSPHTASPRLKNTNEDTMDTIHMDVGLTILSGDLIYISSPEVTKQWNRVNGTPTKIPTMGARRVNKLFVKTNELEKPPQEAVNLV